MIFRFTPDADAELTQAREWYSHQRKDLDLEFIKCIDDTVSRIVNNPHLFPIVYRDLRRALVRRFPYAIIYQIGAVEIQIVAVSHSSRDPDSWKVRILQDSY